METPRLLCGSFLHAAEHRVTDDTKTGKMQANPAFENHYHISVQYTAKLKEGWRGNE